MTESDHWLALAEVISEQMEEKPENRIFLCIEIDEYQKNRDILRVMYDAMKSRLTSYFSANMRGWNVPTEWSHHDMRTPTPTKNEWRLLACLWLYYEALEEETHG